MFGIPDTTEFDLKFRAFGIPVRVHPLFWLIMAVLGWRGDDYQATLIFVACAFVSILIHELGHGLTSTLFGCRPWIVLYGMGGLCYSESERQRPWQRLAVLIMGPGAGLLTFGLLWALFGDRSGIESRVMYRAVGDLLWINGAWSIINLIPIFPLDGGQITGVILGMISRRNGVRWGHVVSLLCAGGLAVYLFSNGGQISALFCAYLAMINFQILQAMHQQGRSGFADPDDAEWWRS